MLATCFRAVVTIVSGSLVYYAFGLHKAAAPMVVPAEEAQAPVMRISRTAG